MKFTIGEWVKGSREAVAEYSEGADIDGIARRDCVRRIVSRERAPFFGQIVGAARRHQGTYVSRGWSQEDPPYLASSGTVIVWLVREGLFNRPIEVLEVDLEPILDALPVSVPDVKVVDAGVWTDEAKQELREEMSQMPRDNKGRWVSRFAHNTRS